MFEVTLFVETLSFVVGCEEDECEVELASE
jgi:hypothetical protein